MRLKTSRGINSALSAKPKNILVSMYHTLTETRPVFEALLSRVLKLRGAGVTSSQTTSAISHLLQFFLLFARSGRSFCMAAHQIMKLHTLHGIMFIRRLPGPWGTNVRALIVHHSESGFEIEPGKVWLAHGPADTAHNR